MEEQAASVYALIEVCSGASLARLVEALGISLQPMLEDRRESDPTDSNNMCEDTPDGF